MKRVLIVTSSYRPTLIADMHRARHLAWELPKLGWEVEILAPSVEFQRPEFVEPESGAMFNPKTPVHEVAPADRWWFRPLKVRGIGWRALEPLDRMGRKLITPGKFDLVFITTANFNLFRLGSRWNRALGVPYLLDFQDPWVRDRLDFRTTRHRFKLIVGAWIARRHEREAVTHASGVVAVSPVYIEELRRRYPSVGSLAPDRCAVIPFAGSENDFRAVSKATAPVGDVREVAYVGAGGRIMVKAFSAFCYGLAALRQKDPSLLANVKIRLHGTSTDWREGDPKILEETAAKFGLTGLVEEHPRRVSYLRATELSLRADGLFVLGVDGPGYMPSKLFGYAITGKPLLASFRNDSPMRELFGRLPGLGHTSMFDPVSGAVAGDVVASVRKFIVEVVERRHFERKAMIAAYLAPAMAVRHVDLFDACLQKKARG